MTVNEADFRDRQNSGALNVEVCSAFRGWIEAISPVSAQNSNPFLAPEWLRLWWEHLGQGNGLYLLVFRDAESVVGYAPLYRARSVTGVREYRLLGHGVSSYLDLVCLPGFENAIVAALLRHLRALAEPSVLDLTDVNNRMSRCFEPLFASADDPSQSAAVVRLYPCPIVRLSSDWTEFLREHRASKTRKHLRRNERQLSEFGEWRVREIRDFAEAQRLLPDLTRIHRERFEFTTNHLFDGRSLTFWKCAIPRLLAHELVLSVLEVVGTTVSFVVGFRFADVFVYFAPAFDPAWACVSVGQVHLVNLMEQLANEGTRYFDFSKGEAPYKRSWSDDETANYRFRFSFNLPTHAKLYHHALNAALRLLVYGRDHGYNARAKRWLAKARANWPPWRSRTRVRSVELVRDTTAFDSAEDEWSYARLVHLPVSVRSWIIENAVKAGRPRQGIAVSEADRTVILPSNTSGRRVAVKY